MTPGPVVTLGRRGLSLRARWTILPSRDAPADVWFAGAAWYQFDFYAANGREFLAFHLHPDGASRVTRPHAHIIEAPGTLPRLLDRAHIPTPPLSFPDVVRFAITDLGVECRRTDWETVLAHDEP